MITVSPRDARLRVIDETANPQVGASTPLEFDEAFEKTQVLFEGRADAPVSVEEVAQALIPASL